MPESKENLSSFAAKRWGEVFISNQIDAEQRVRLFTDALHAGIGDRNFWLARKGGIVTLLSENWLKTAPPPLKRLAGWAVNEVRKQAEAKFAETAPPKPGAGEAVDISLPGRLALVSPPHPVLRVLDEIVAIFLGLGYSVADGPEIETTYYNFEALNIPAAHPAREEQDTLYLDAAPAPRAPEWGGGGPHAGARLSGARGAAALGPAPTMVLRTHTSPVQIHVMESQRPPLRVIVPGKVYRRDAPDATHSPNFHQVEGLAVDEHLTLRDLKGTLDYFARALLGPSVTTRLRPSYFQFTEPSAELDVSCIFCAGKGCRTCKQSGWIELLGCGMVDPAVFGYVNYDPEKYSGFAFGMGVERLAMIRYQVDDIQRFYSGDLRFLEQFRD